MPRKGPGKTLHHPRDGDLDAAVSLVREVDLNLDLGLDPDPDQNRGPNLVLL